MYLILFKIIENNPLYADGEIVDMVELIESLSQDQNITYNIPTLKHLLKQNNCKVKHYATYTDLHLVPQNTLDQLQDLK